MLQLYMPCLLRAHCDIIEVIIAPSDCLGELELYKIEIGPIEHLYLCVEIDPETGKCKKFIYAGCFQVVKIYYRCVKNYGKPIKWGMNYWQNKFNLIKEMKIGPSRITIDNYSHLECNEVFKKHDYVPMSYNITRLSRTTS